MAEPVKENRKGKSSRKYLSRLVLAIICLLGLVVLCVAIYLATPLPARHLSRYLTSYLHETVSIDRVKTSGTTIYLKGVQLANPPGFPSGNLAVADSLAIAPGWGNLLFGRQSFRLIGLEGVTVSLEKNGNGVWNFAQLQQLLSKRKPSPKETRIGELSIKGGSLSVNGQRVQGIALQVFNLATKGSRESKLDISFEDAAHNAFSLKGEARPGADPSVDLTLTAPSLSLKGVAKELKLKQPEFFEGGTGSLAITSNFHKGELNADGTFRFDHLRYAAAGKSYPLAGALDFSAQYSLKEDVARLKTLQLKLANLVQLHATGSAHDLKKERRFVLDLGFNEVDLATVNGLVPEQTRKMLVFGGRLGGKALHLAGSGGKVTEASGTLQLREGSVAKGATLYVSGLAGTIGVARAGEGVAAKGRLTVSEGAGKPLLQTLDLPFQLTLSHGMKPLRAEFPSLSAELMGLSFSGRASFDAGRASPVAASLTAPQTRLSELQALLQRYDLKVSSGTASATVEISWKSLQQFDADTALQLAEVSAVRGKDRLAVKRGKITAKVTRGGGHLAAQGSADLKGASLNDKGGDARFSYRLADSAVRLDNAEVVAAGAQVSIAHLTGTLPVAKGVAAPHPVSHQTARSYPLSFDFDGCSVKRGELGVTGLAGRVRSKLLADSGGKWLEGTADLSAGSLTWHGNPVAAPVLRAVFSRPGAKGDLGGRLFAGALSGSVSGNPFATAKSVSFDLSLKGAQLNAALPLLPKGKTTPKDGLIDLDLKGTYAPGALSCRFSSKATRLAFAGAGGKTLLSGAALVLSGDLAKDLLTVGDARFSPGPEANLSVQGKVLHPFANNRSGKLTFSLGETRANSIIDPLANVLPRAVQEATIDGRVGVRGTLLFEEGAKLLEGGLVFTGGRYEVPQQKLAVTGINGRFPFSLDLSGKTGGKPPSAMMFSRDNYPKLLVQLNSAGGGGDQLYVDRIVFGPLELETLTVHLKAKNGITEIRSLRSSLYDGILLGKGYLTMREGLGYRGDLLINGVSLKQLCSKFPGIKGYISGRVDGVLSISGGSKGLAGVAGFTELWAREGGGEKMLVSKEFLQRLAKQKLGGFFFRSDRSYDQAEIKALMEGGNLTFETLEIVHTNLFGVRDLNVTMSPTQNRIELGHLLDSIKEAASREKATTTGEPPPSETPAPQEFKWGE